MADVEKEELRVFAAVSQHDRLLEHLLEDAEENLRIVLILLDLRVDVVKHQQQQLVQLLRQSVLEITNVYGNHLHLLIAGALLVVVVHDDLHLRMSRADREYVDRNQLFHEKRQAALAKHGRIGQ